MTGDHFIRTYDEVIDAEACWVLIEFLTTGDGPRPATAPGAPADHKIFDELFFNSHQSDPAWRAVAQRLAEVFRSPIVDYISRVPHLEPHRLVSEGFRFKRYRRGVGQIATHIDQTCDTPARALAAIMYLNDVHEGGETEFPLHAVSVQPRAGRMLIAPAAWTHPHCSRPPLSSAKFIVNDFMCFGHD